MGRRRARRRSAGQRVLAALGVILGLLALLVVVGVIFPDVIYNLSYLAGWIVGHIVRLFTG